MKVKSATNKKTQKRRRCRQRKLKVLNDPQLLLQKAILSGVRCAINDHPVITKQLTGSVVKRIFGAALAYQQLVDNQPKQNILLHDRVFKAYIQPTIPIGSRLSVVG